MTPDALLIELQTRGIKIRRDGDRLLVTDQSKALTPGLSAAIKKHKAALLDRLPVVPHEQLPLAVSTSPMGTAQSAGFDSPPARASTVLQSGDILTLPGVHQTMTPDEIAALLAAGQGTPALRVEALPNDPARLALFERMVSDPRCAAYYAAEWAFCDALDHGDEAAIGAASQRFEVAHRAALQLAAEIEPEKT